MEKTKRNWVVIRRSGRILQLSDKADSVEDVLSALYTDWASGGSNHDNAHLLILNGDVVMHDVDSIIFEWDRSRKAAWEIANSAIRKASLRLIPALATPANKTEGE